MTRYIPLAILFGLLVGCAPLHIVGQPLGAPPLTDQQRRDQARCEAKGGRWEWIGGKTSLPAWHCLAA